MVVGAGLAPALFPVSQIYSLLPSLLGTPHDGSRGRIRTSDMVINSHPQLPLCYSGVEETTMHFPGLRLYGPIFRALALEGIRICCALRCAHPTESAPAHGCKLADPVGIEPTTSESTVRRSSQLN